MTGQRVPMLVRLGRIRDAVRSAQVAAASSAQLPVGSTRAADIAYWSGLAALADGRAADAAANLQTAHRALAEAMGPRHVRAALAQCALGVALARSSSGTEARVQLLAGCPPLARWGLADPTVVGWAARAIASTLPGPSGR